jgi:hypothetical protein
MIITITRGTRIRRPMVIRFGSVIARARRQVLDRNYD